MKVYPKLYKIALAFGAACAIAAIAVLFAKGRSAPQQISTDGGTAKQSASARVAAAELKRVASEPIRSQSVAPIDSAGLAQTQLEAEYRAASAARDAKSIREIAKKYEAGVGGSGRDLERARILFNEAAALGDVEAMYRSGFYAENGLGGAADGESARDWYEKAGEAGNAEGYAAVARMYIEGRAIAPDPTAALKYVELGLNGGSNDARFLKGLIMLDSAKPADALSLLRAAAENGSADAQKTIARLYREGLLLPRDEEKAIEWAKMAAEAGSNGARADLARLLIDKDGGTAAAPGSVSEAVRGLMQAASEGDSRASLEVARLSLEKAPENMWDIEFTRSNAVRAFEGGQEQGAFIAAFTYAIAKQEAEAQQWLAKGVLAGDWRSKYAQSLMEKTGFSLNEAIKTAINADRSDYEAIRAANTPPNKTGTTPPSPINMDMPKFPAGLAALATRGSVTAEFVVNEKGVPTGIKILDSTHPQLSAATIEAVSKWRFSPAMRNGAAVPMRLRLPVRYKSSK